MGEIWREWLEVISFREINIIESIDSERNMEGMVGDGLRRWRTRLV